MSVKLTYISNITAVETLGTDVPFANASKNSITHDGMDTSLTLNGTSTPPVSVISAQQIALSAGAHTIDLTSLLGSNGLAVSLSGLKPRAIKFRNPATNANSITIAQGAVNGHPLLGASFSITLQPGQEILAYLKDAATAVDGTHKTIDLTGTGTQALDVDILGG